MSMGELLSLADDDARSRWENLRLGYTESLGLPALRTEIASLYPGLEADAAFILLAADGTPFIAIGCPTQLQFVGLEEIATVS